ncbi:S8 family peptidase [Pseudomonas syringae]|nr:S8 family serine peptidase [Pseudomonas syringae]PBP35306.1 peptidase S8 [Pseudomonas syringae]
MEKYLILRKSSVLSGVFTRSMAGTPGMGALAVERVPSHALSELRRDPDVLAVTPPMAISLINPMEQLTSSVVTANAWGIASVGAGVSPFNGEGVVVAVLDTGIETSHPAFIGMDINERDFTREGNGDKNGHGTHCAGTIFGRDINNQRIGVARGVSRALIGKVIGQNSGSSQAIFEALQWAMREQANVISMSIGFDFPGEVQKKVDNGWPADLATSQALETYRGNIRLFDALMGFFKAQSAFDAAPLVIAAAGNESRRSVNRQYKIAASIPAAADGVLSVAAVQPLGNQYRIADFSNSFALLSAPGVNILSAWLGGSLKAIDGTSMACPHVAGVAALWWQFLQQKNIPNRASSVAAHLTAHARSDCFMPGFDASDFGHGLVTCPH